jgi:hypothetical protein
LEKDGFEFVGGNPQAFPMTAMSATSRDDGDPVE